MARIDQAKLWSIGFLHMGQSFPGALAAVALPAIFRQEGLPLELFWLFALPLIPSWLRWLVALVVDNWGSVSFGFRKSWIVPCTLLGACIYTLIASLSPSIDSIAMIIALLCIKSVVMTAQDVAVDGLAVESFGTHERSQGAAIIVLLMFIGTVAAQALVVGVEQLGWQTSMNIAALLLVVAALPACLRREAPPPAAAAARRQRGQSASIIEYLTRYETRLVLPVLLVVGFSSNLMRAMLPVFLVDIGLTLTEIGVSFGVAVVVGASLASATIPRLAPRVGLRKLVIWVVVGYAPCLILFAALNGYTASTALVAGSLIYVMYISTAMWMLVMQARMAWSGAHQAATDFSAQASVTNLGEWLGASIAGFAVAMLGWSWFFHIGWSLSVIAGIAFLCIIKPVNASIEARGSLELT